MQIPAVQLPNNETPLEQIQHAERECAQRCQAAQELAEDQIRAAHQEAARRKHDALETSRQQASHDHDNRVASVHLEGQALVEQATKQAADLTQAGEAAFDRMVSQALELLVGFGEEELGHGS